MAAADGDEGDARTLQPLLNLVRKALVAVLEQPVHPRLRPRVEAGGDRDESEIRRHRPRIAIGPGDEGWRDHAEHALARRARHGQQHAQLAQLVGVGFGGEYAGLEVYGLEAVDLVTFAVCDARDFPVDAALRLEAAGG